MGGTPFAVGFRLILASVVVGIVLDTLGINFRNFFYRMHDVIHLLYDIGLQSFEWLFHYFLLGAILVVPLWALSRLAKSRRSGN